MTDSKKEVSKVLFVTLSNLGDVVLTLPALQLLRENYPNALIDVLVGHNAACVFDNDIRVRRLISYNKKGGLKAKLDLLLSIRSERYDIILDLRRSVFGFLGGAKKRNSYFRFTRRTLHQAKRHFRAAQELVKKRRPSNREPFLEVDEASFPAYEKMFYDNSKPIVVAAVGSKSDIKRWPEKSFAVLLDRLIVTQGCQIILVGDKNDSGFAEKVEGLMTKSVINLCGKTDFRELGYLLKKATLLVTNDSAPLHIADHLKTPVLAIFGPTSAKKYGPRQPHSVAVRRELFCSPCQKAQCRYHFECMNELTVDDVHRRCVSMLEDRYQAKNIKILVMRLDRIGDVVLSLPAVSAIRERFPNAHISMVTRASTRQLVEGHPDIDEVIPYYYEKKGRHSFIVGNLRFIYEIIKRRFDIAFILHPSHRSYMVPFWAGIPYRIGFKSHDWFLLTKAVPDNRSQGLKHESDYTMDIVRAFGISPDTIRRPQIAVAYEHEYSIQKFFREASWTADQPVIAIHTDASCSSKKWPIDNYRVLAKKILDETPFNLVIVGGQADAEFAVAFTGEQKQRLIDLRGRISLKELAALLKKCKVLITNDSGPSHVASAVGTRVLCIFGRNHSSLSAKRWKPLGQPDEHRVIQKDVGCKLCLAHRCPIHFECLRIIDPREVFSVLLEMVGDKK